MIHILVSDDQKVKVVQIYDTVNISTDLLEIFCMKKYWARLVPRILTKNQEQQFVYNSERNLAIIQRNPNVFFKRNLEFLLKKLKLKYLK